MAKNDNANAKNERAKRLAAELRANLRRRKVQNRAHEAEKNSKPSAGDGNQNNS